MISGIKHYIKVTVYLIKMSIQTNLEYPMEFFGWLFANPIQFLLGIATVKFVITQFGMLGGWAFGEIAFLYGLAILSYGLSAVLFVQTWFMGSFILDGEFDIFMLRPMNVLYQFFFCIFNIYGFSDLLPGIVIFIYGCVQVHFNWSFINIMMLVSVVTGATLIRGALYLVTGSVAFWTKNRNSYTMLNLTIFDQTTKYPLSIYPRVVQIIFTFVLPLGFISFYPAKDFLNKNSGVLFSGNMAWFTLLVGIFLFWLATRLFRRGLTKYESAGS